MSEERGEEEITEEISTEEVKVETPEALEEAPAGFVVDINGLEFMIKVSDLLYEAARSGNPSKYIEEIEKLSKSATTAKERKKKEAAKAPEKKKPTPASRKRKKSK